MSQEDAVCLFQNDDSAGLHDSSTAKIANENKAILLQNVAFKDLTGLEIRKQADQHSVLDNQISNDASDLDSNIFMLKLFTPELNTTKLHFSNEKTIVENTQAVNQTTGSM